MQNTGLIDWSEADYAACGHKPWLARHRLQQDPMFSRDSLIELLDVYPRDALQAFTMGYDTTRAEEWAPVDTGQASGAELWQAVSRGRLWLNLLSAEHIPLSQGSTRAAGPVAAAKRFAYRAAKRLRGVPKPAVIDYVARYSVDPEAADGLRVLDHPARTAFSKA